MPTGKIKFYNKEKGYGFILQDDGGQDVFLHNSSLIDKVLLDAGCSVEFIITSPDPKTLPSLVERTAPKKVVEETTEEAEEVDKAKETSKFSKARTPTRIQDQTDIRMSVAFMTNQIQTKAPLEFVFIDNEF